MDHILDSDIHIISEITKNISILDKLIKSETFEIEEKYKGHEKRINYFFSSLLKGEITNEYIKILTNSIEDRYARQNGCRAINIDPGYIASSKLVLATTKNYSHRIYLRDGIFAEVTFNFRKNSIEFNPWTYPDYKLPATTEFFIEVHRKYMEALKGN